MEVNTAVVVGATVIDKEVVRRLSEVDTVIVVRAGVVCEGVVVRLEKVDTIIAVRKTTIILKYITCSSLKIEPVLAVI